MQTQKPGEGKTIYELILQLLVAEVKKSLDDQSLEHKDHIQGFAPSRSFPLGLAQGISQNETKHLEVNMLSQLLQGISQTAQRGKSLAFIKKVWYVFIQ
jgi:hypothetical protein